MAVALSTEDKIEIRELITSSFHTGCLCGLSHETQEEVGHFFGRIKDLGGGNLNKGVEIFSKAVEMVARHRRLGEKIGGAVAVFVFLTFTGGALTVFGAGIIQWIKKVMAP